MRHRWSSIHSSMIPPIMPSRLRLLPVLFFLLAFAPVSFATIRGIVYQSGANGVSGVRLTARRAETADAQRARILAGVPRPALAVATSQENGSFELAIDAPGIVEVIAEAGSYAPAVVNAQNGDEEVVIELRSARTLEGRVTASGKPVAHARIMAVAGRHVLYATTASEQGTWSMPEPNGWASEIVVLHPDHAATTINAGNAARTRLEVEMKPGATVTGRVIDAGRRPVAKAIVSGGAWTSVITDDEGKFTLRHVGDAVKRIEGATRGAVGSASRIATDLVIRLEERASLQGMVRDADGRPLPGAEIVAYRTVAHDAPPVPSYAVSDESGRYQMSSVDAAELSVHASGTAQQEFNIVKVSLRQARTATADFTAKRRNFISGIVVDRDGKAVGGAVVQYVPPQVPLLYGSGQDDGHVRTSPAGRFRLQKIEASHRSMEGVRVQAVHPAYAVGVSEPLAEGKDAAIKVIVSPGIELRGVVVDEKGLPVADAGIVAVQDPIGGVPLALDAAMSSGAVQPLVRSDREGRFKLQLNSRTHDLGIWKSGFSGARVGDLTPVADAEELRVVLDKGVEIRGRVVSSGKAVTAGTVIASSDEGAFLMTDVGADGSFTFSALRPGPWEIEFQDEEQRSGEARATAPASDVVIDLPATAQVRVRLVDAATKAALTQYRMEVEVRGNSTGSVVEGEEVSIINVPPGAVTVTARAAGYGPATGRVTANLEEPADVTLEAVRGRALSGRIIDSDGRAVAEARLRIDGDFVSSEADGSYRFESLPRTAVKLAVRADGYMEKTSDIPAGESDSVLDITLSTGRAIRGRVVTSEGLPVAGAMVMAMGEESQQAETDADGAFTMSGLAAGNYSFHARSQDLESEPLEDVGPSVSEVIVRMKPALGTGSVHGKVAGFADGGWTFGVVHAGDTYRPTYIARDGSYRIERVEAGEVELRAEVTSRSGSATSPAVKVLVTPGGDVEANLAFRDDVIVRGTVVDTGKIAAGRKVEFSRQSARWSATTDHRGVYELRGVEPNALYEVSVEGGESSFETSVHVARSFTFDIRIDWQEVEARVIDATGAPLANVAVALLTADSRDDAGTMETGPDGVVKLRTLRRPHVITASRSGYATVTQRVEAGAPPLVLQMRPSSGLRVRLMDARNGRSMDGYVVAVDSAGLQVARTEEKESDGTMRVPIGPGRYRVAVSANGFASQSRYVTTPQEEEVQFALTPGGTLVVKTGNASDDLVKLVQPNGEEYVRCQCNGIAEIRLTGTTTRIEHVAPGDFTMHVLDARGRIKTSQPVKIMEGQTSTTDIHVPAN
jgi:hypothetical protein